MDTNGFITNSGVEIMRILSWTELFWPYIGGVEVQCLHLLTALRKRGHQVAAFTSHGSLSLPDVDEHLGIPIYRFPFFDALKQQRVESFPKLLRGVAELKKQFRPDVVHIQFTDPSPVFHWLTQASAPAATVVTIPIALPKSGDGADSLVGQTLHSAAWVVACSRAMLDRTREEFPGIAEKSSVIYNALPASRIAAPAAARDPRALLAIGRVVRDKGFDLAIDAMPGILRNFPDSHLTIAGDVPEKAALEQRAAELGVASRTRFLGWVAPERIADLIAQASIVVMPSRWEEAFGLVALEAMQVGRPVIATRVGGLPEVVMDGRCGLVVPKEDPEALAAAAVSLLADPAKAATMGESGRVLAETHFSFARFVGEYERLFIKVLK